MAEKNGSSVKRTWLRAGRSLLKVEKQSPIGGYRVAGIQGSICFISPEHYVGTLCRNKLSEDIRET